nr:amine oxidoreductase [Lachnospiraceae bacterium]
HNFCKGRGYWTETRAERTKLFKQEDNGPAFMNEYAYPLNTVDKPAIMDKLLTYMRKKDILGLGRWGEHSHFNSDLVVQKALALSDVLHIK